jgi:predicted acylesterase/phospholipase RssA
VRLLAIDGGGIRGLVPALVLAELERRTGRRTAELFDVIAGTSTGGLIACGLARPDPLSAAALAEAYVEEGPQIFRASLLKRIFSVGGLADERYEDSGLVATLRRRLGETRLSETTTEVFVTAYDIEARAAFFFRSARARQDPAEDYALVDVARATAAAPTYFEPIRVRGRALIDGGVFAANPSLVAYVEALRAGEEVTLLASLGTGTGTEPIPYERARWWGQLEWARPLIGVVFDGIAETTEFSLGTLLGETYVRLAPTLDEAQDDLDDASPENLAALRRAAERLIAERSADIERLAAALVA